jgi:hypothetical protein
MQGMGMLALTLAGHCLPLQLHVLASATSLIMGA